MKITSKYPGVMPAIPDSAVVKAGPMTINGIPMVWPDGTAVRAGDIKGDMWLEVNVETGVTTEKPR